MQRQQVSSSNIASVGYDAASHVLEIEFNNGSVYHYYDVPPAVHQQLMNAPSHGIFLNTNIKGTYRYAPQ